jgi:hypothetical protein
MVTKEEHDELKEIVGITQGKEEEKAVPIFYDGRQYSIRIPKKFADALEISTEKDKFLFKLIVKPQENGGINISLNGTYIKDYGKDKTKVQ